MAQSTPLGVRRVLGSTESIGHPVAGQILPMSYGRAPQKSFPYILHNKSEKRCINLKYTPQSRAKWSHFEGCNLVGAAGWRGSPPRVSNKHSKLHVQRISPSTATPLKNFSDMPISSLRSWGKDVTWGSRRLVCPSRTG